MSFIMVWERFIKALAKLLVILGLLFCAVQYICVSWYDEKKLNDGYYLTLWARNYYVIDYRNCFLSENSSVLHERVIKLEFSSEFIFAQTEKGRFWVINKTKKVFFDYEQEQNHRCSSLSGPMDSLAFTHYKDSVHFISKQKDRWTLKQ